MINTIKRIKRRNPALFGFGAAVALLLVASLIFRIALRILILVLILAAVQWIFDLIQRRKNRRWYSE